MARNPSFGKRAPDFVLPASFRPEFHFNLAAGRNIVLVFLGSPLSIAAAALLAEARSLRASFDDRLASVFFIVSDRAHVAELGLKGEELAIRYLLDPERTAALAYGLLSGDDSAASPDAPVKPGLFVLDRNLRFVLIHRIEGVRPYLAPIVDGLRKLDARQSSNDAINLAPVLVVERIFEPAFCRHLIEYYEKRGGEPTGFMVQEGNLTALRLDDRHKRREDCPIVHAPLVEAIERRIRARLLPEVKRVFQFEATQIERHIIACYDAARGGYFRRHRDNTTPGTAHRRFAVTLNLNAGEYDGGALRFPEFGDRAYVAPTGGAVVFSCSLLHEAMPVTRGTRYAYLPFLYGEADIVTREQSIEFLDERSGGRAKIPG